jgi:hydrogenase expression/formation protein HypD
MEKLQKTLDEIKFLTANITAAGKFKKINIMEVCGTHTMSIARYGLTQLLPTGINLISGPGCPVCVTPAKEIDNIIGIIRKYKLAVFTFGDMIKVPGTFSSLSAEKMSGAEIKICYSPSDSIRFAEQNPEKKVMFVAIGFETTIPLTSVIIKNAFKKRLKNFSVFSTHKIIPPALDALLSDRNVQVNGLLLPGHVSAIIGSGPYEFIASKYNIPAVISGFGPEDILISIKMMLEQLINSRPIIENSYTGVVKNDGNPYAFSMINAVFSPVDAEWRGLGIIPLSGMELKDSYSVFDARKSFPVKVFSLPEPAGCECGEILKGIKKPTGCKLFAVRCRPDNPVGPCMVSSEGTCAAYFKYLRRK